MRRFANRAKMRAMVALRAKGFGTTNACEHRSQCHSCARLRPNRIAGATNPLSTAPVHIPS